MFVELLNETKRVAEEANRVEYVKLSSLLPCPYNREIDQAKVEDIKNKIRETGVVKPFVVTEVSSDNGRTLMITDGHHRHLALQELIKDGLYNEDSMVPVMMADEKGVKTADAAAPQAVKESHSHSKCMECDAKPTIEVSWANGHGHAWFCDKCYAKWSKENKGDILSAKEVKDGEAAKKFADNKNPNILKEATTEDELYNRQLMGEWRNKNIELAKKDKKIAQMMAVLTDNFNNGTIVVIHVPGGEEDIDIINARGEFFNMPVKMMRGQASRCHSNVAIMYQDSLIDTIVTGYGLSKDNMWRAHSWGLLGDKLIETTEKRVKYYGARLDEKEAENFVFNNF